MVNMPVGCAQVRIVGFDCLSYLFHQNINIYLSSSISKSNEVTTKNFKKWWVKNQTLCEEDLKELLKRCSRNLWGCLRFRKSKDISKVEKIVMGIIDRHLEPDQREILADSDDSLRMYEDLEWIHWRCLKLLCWWSRPRCKHRQRGTKRSKNYWRCKGYVNQS